MAKVSLLDEAGPLTGAETMPIVQDGEMKRVPFDTVLDQQLAVLAAAGEIQTAAAATQAAQTARDAAALNK